MLHSHVMSDRPALDRSGSSRGLPVTCVFVRKYLLHQLFRDLLTRKVTMIDFFRYVEKYNYGVFWSG